IGKVASVNGSSLSLVDGRDGVEFIDSDEVWLEKRAFPDYLDFVFIGNERRVAMALEKARAELRSGPNKLQRITSVVDYLRSRRHLLAPDVSFEFGPLLDDASQGFPAFETAPKPTYIYDQTGSKTDTWNDGGLNKHGPYTAKVFTPNRPRICVICQKSQKGTVEAFLHKFINGVVLPAQPASYNGKPQRKYFEK